MSTATPAETSSPASTSASTPTAAACLPEVLMIVPWEDPVVDAIGTDVQSTYVQQFWLSVLGPTATWILRILAGGLARYPYGYEQDVAELAATLGLARSLAAGGPFGRALQRCELFGVTRTIPGALAVRRRLPPLSARQLARLPAALQEAHRTWQRQAPAADERRASQLAATLRHLGDDASTIERCLLAAGVGATAAAVAAGTLDGIQAAGG